MALTPEQEKVIREVQAKLREEQIAQMPEGLPGMYYVEPAVRMASAAAGDVLGGFAGAVRTAGGLLAGEGEEAPRAGLELLRSTQNLAQQFPDIIPGMETQRGARGMQRLQEVTEPVLGPIARGFERESQKLADVAFEATGSPLAATAAYTAPTAALELGALKLLRGARPQVAFFDAEGRPTRELLDALNEAGFSYEDLVQEAVRELPTTAKRDIAGLPAISESLEPAQRAQIEGGGREAALAPLMVEGTRLASDPLAQQTIEAWREPGLIQAVKQATPQTRAKMNRMLNIQRRIGQDSSLAAKMRPTDVTGESLVERTDYLQKVLDVNNTRLRNIVNDKFPTLQVNTQPIVNAYEEMLGSMGITRALDDQLVFEGSQVSQNKNAQNQIMKVENLLREDVPVTARRLHNVKKQLDDILYETQSQGDIARTGKDIMQAVRVAINNTLREADKDYAQANDIISEILGSYSAVERFLGKDIRLDDPKAATKLGQEARKLFTNYAARAALTQAIAEIDSTAARYGGRFDDSVTDLAMFANALGHRFDTAATGSLEGLMQKQQKRQALGEAAKEIGKATVDQTGQAGTRIGSRLAQIFLKGKENSDQEAYRLMEELLRRGG